jgi:hypothetical protein
MQRRRQNHHLHRPGERAAPTRWRLGRAELGCRGSGPRHEGEGEEGEAGRGGGGGWRLAGPQREGGEKEGGRWAVPRGPKKPGLHLGPKSQQEGGVYGFSYFPYSSKPLINEYLTKA